jgi:flagellin
MESQIRGLNMNIRNAKDGQSMVDTQEGALQEIAAILQRMRELAVQASGGAVTSADRDYLDLENMQLSAEVNAISLNTKFNNVTVMSTAYSFFTDIDVKGTSIDIANKTMSAESLAITSANISIGSADRATGGPSLTSVLTTIDAAIKTVDDRRANLCAASNRFDHIIDNLTNVVANTEAAKSRVEDADFAVETTQLTRNTVLQQAATSMGAQANASKNTILALLQG